MRFFFRLVAVPVVCALAGGTDLGPGRSEPSETGSVQPPSALRLPLVFVENRGQFDAQVRFQTRVPGLAASVLADGWAVHDAEGTSSLRLRFRGADAAARVEGLERRPGVAHFLTGGEADGGKRVHGAATYGRVRIAGIRPGVDVELFETRGGLKYDVLVAAGVDEADVVFTLDGARESRIDPDGALVVVFGSQEIRLCLPQAWQTAPDGERHVLPSGFRRVGEHAFGFRVEGRDRELPLVIDPVLVYSEHVGGSSADEAWGVAAGPDGAVYVTGWAKSTDFPLAGGARRGKDAVVFKIDAAGELAYVTTIGGRHDDEGRAIAVDAEGRATVVGETRSLDFPTTKGAHGTVKKGNTDAFVLRLAADGGTLEYATYLGGARDDVANGVALGRDGSAYVVGTTHSRDFPASSHAIQTRRKGVRDAFVTKVDPDGKFLVYSTYLGGARDDEGRGIAVDEDGHAFVTGFTSSGDFPTTTACLDDRKNDIDAFLTRLAVTGGSLMYSTYLGGSAQDQGMGVALAAEGEAYVVGWTQSFDFPVTSDAVQESNRARRDGFLVRVSAAGSVLTYGSYLGGAGHDEALDVAVDSRGIAWVVGHTTSSDLPVTRDAAQRERAGGKDAFLIGIDPQTASVFFGTYLGGEGDDVVRSLDVQRGSENLALAGFADDIPPAARGRYAGGRRGPSDVLVARYEPGRCGARAEVAALGSPCGVRLEVTPPRLGRFFELRVRGGPPRTEGYVMISSPTYASTLVEGVCERHVDPETTKIFRRFVTDEKGRWEFRARLPRDKEQCGRTLIVQVMTFDEERGPLSFGQMSEGRLVTFGD